MLLFDQDLTASYLILFCQFVTYVNLKKNSVGTFPIYFSSEIGSDTRLKWSILKRYVHEMLNENTLLSPSPALNYKEVI